MELKSSKEKWDRRFDESISEIDYYQRRGAPLFVNRYYEHQLRRAFNLVIRNSNIGGRSLVLEIGSGTGRWAQQLINTNMNCTYYGIDFNHKAIILAHNKKLPNCHFLTMDGMELAFKSNCFDYAISITAIQHIPSEGWRAAVREMIRVVKPGGAIALVESNRYPWIEEFLTNGCELLIKRGQGYSFARELPERAFTLPTKLNRFLTTLSYALEPMFEKIVPIRFAKHIILVFRKQ